MEIEHFIEIWYIFDMFAPIGKEALMSYSR